MPYSHYEHRHNFAVWCAARAVQRKFAKTPILKEALESSGVVEFIKDNEDNDITPEDFNRNHESWCDSIIKTWQSNNIAGASYGRAAKLVAVYIKSMTVVRNGHSKLAMVAHPPIDRIILKNISKDYEIRHDNKSDWGKINWTELDKDKYKNLIKDFRQVFDNQPLWIIEKYWTITNE